MNLKNKLLLTRIILDSMLKIIPKIFVSTLFIVTLLLESPHAQTHIYSTEIWGKWLREKSPYYIHGNVTITSKNKLIIEAGVQIMFTGHYSLIAKGSLEAQGSKTDSIIFSAADSEKGWNGIRFINTQQNNNLNFCTFKYVAAKAFIGDYVAQPEKDTTAVFNEDGGAIICMNSRVNIFNCTFKNNCAMVGGGAISCIDNSKVRITHCKIQNNDATLSGGGICISNSKASIENCLISGNSAQKRGGGGLDCLRSEIKITDCVISDNTSYSGGGVRCIYESIAEINNCTIERNYAKYGGGIEFNENTNGKIVNSTLTKNQADFGGAVCIVEFSNPKISNCDIRDNISRKKGGGIFIAESGKSTISDCSIINNYSEGDGGGIYCLDVSPVLESLIIKNNSADHNGGGIYSEFARIKLAGLTINFNNAQKGAGIYFENCPGIVFKKEKRSNIYSNRAEQLGSDLCVLSGPTTEVYLDTFTVAKPSEIHAYPLSNLKLNIKHAKIFQFSSDLYVDQFQGDDLNSGLSPSDPLCTLHMAFSKILADSIEPHIIYLNNGEYTSAGIDLVLSLKALKFVSISSYWQSELRIVGDKIVVFTPWWKSYAAFISYFCIFIILLFGFWYYQRRRQSIKNQLLREHLEADKLREMDHLKSRFFANISHEFRTPLTLILGPMQSVLAKIRDVGLKNELNLVLRNATRLERLVNQLLDLSRLEAGKMNLEVQQLDIIPLLRKIVLAFTSLAERKKISLKYKSTSKSLFAYIDQDKIEKIINNLLSNAFKFTPEGGRISVTASELHPPQSPLDRGKDLFPP
jgi:predicted outer membrane repeat protein